MKDVNVNGQRDVNDELVGFLSIFGNIFQKDGNPATAAVKLGEKKTLKLTTQNERVVVVVVGDCDTYRQVGSCQIGQGK